MPCWTWLAARDPRCLSLTLRKGSIFQFPLQRFQSGVRGGLGRQLALQVGTQMHSVELTRPAGMALGWNWAPCPPQWHWSTSLNSFDSLNKEIMVNLGNRGWRKWRCSHLNDFYGAARFTDLLIQTSFLRQHFHFTTVLHMWHSNEFLLY